MFAVNATNLFARLKIDQNDQTEPRVFLLLVTADGHGKHATFAGEIDSCHGSFHSNPALHLAGGDIPDPHTAVVGDRHGLTAVRSEHKPINPVIVPFEAADLSKLIGANCCSLKPNHTRLVMRYRCPLDATRLSRIQACAEFAVDQLDIQKDFLAAPDPERLGLELNVALLDVQPVFAGANPQRPLAGCVLKAEAFFVVDRDSRIRVVDPDPDCAVVGLHIDHDAGSKKEHEAADNRRYCFDSGP